MSNLVGQYFVQCVAVAAQRNSAVSCHIVYIYVLVYVDNKLALGVNLDQNIAA